MEEAAERGRPALFLNLKEESAGCILSIEMEEQANTSYHGSNTGILSCFVPHVGMEFKNSDEACAFGFAIWWSKGL